MSQIPYQVQPLTWKPDKASLQRPVYCSLAERLEMDIVEGLLPPGTRLPPQRELADYLGINFTTVTRAYKLCEFKGLIYAVTGSGTFVAANAARSITTSADQAPGNIIELGFVASFEQTNSLVAEAAKKAVSQKYLPELLNYNDPIGKAHHKLAAVSWVKNFGLEASAEQTIIVSGAQNALSLSLMALFIPGQRIATDQYTYPNFITLARMLHIHLMPVKGDIEGMLPEELDAQCKQMDVHGVFLMPSCNNPTTIMISDRRKHELAEVIRRHKLILVEDDIHAFLNTGVVNDYRQPMSALLPEQSIYICSTSKSICAGLRVAFMVCAGRFLHQISQAVYSVNVKTSALDAEIIADLILSGQAYNIAEDKKRFAAKVNSLFDYYFPQPGRSGHPLCLFRWLPISAIEPGAQVEADLERKGVRVYHSSRFMVGQGDTGQYLRLSLASTRDMEELEKGLTILKAHLKQA